MEIPDLEEIKNRLGKIPRNFRYLASGEERLARSVFEGSLPYKRIVISDGLGLDNRPFTVPEPMTSRYILNLGDTYAMTVRDEDKALLIHELTHVWQGEHGDWRGDYVFQSVWHQAKKGNKAYKYDPDHLGRWTQYNPEQQASLVEDWYKVLRDDGPAAAERDPRFRPYIQFWIRGKRTIEVPDVPSREKRAVKLRVAAHESGLQIPGDALFAFDSASLRSQARTHLKKAVGILNEKAQGRTVLVLGHTDAVGSKAYNHSLSRRRASTIKKWLEHNGAKVTLKADGKGEMSPVASNTTAAGRAKNRRVEFWYQ